MWFGGKVYLADARKCAGLPALRRATGAGRARAQPAGGAENPLDARAWVGIMAAKIAKQGEDR